MKQIGLVPNSADTAKIQSGKAAMAKHAHDWNPIALADQLFDLRQSIDRIATQLSGALLLDMDDLVADARRIVAEQVCTIAVVGQIKSGKSTFINAWLRRPNLLPTSVNPWTTSVTHIRLGQGGPDGIAARFTFFDQDEWKKIAEDGGPIRELTQRFVEGFEPELLKLHLESMRRRSQTRLGDEIGSLLGQHHDYVTLTRDVLDKYVCAGPLETSDRDEQVGRYSDLTRRADLYIDVDPPVFPVTLIDTPGTNDPFLVRDEITRRVLSEADAHIVVMTARQILTAQDLSLLQIIHGLNKSQVVVFINRIDELAEPARDVPEVEKRLRGALARACPGLSAAIVFGSAHWAEMALKSHPAMPLEAIDGKLTRYAAAAHEAKPALIETDADHPAQTRTSQSDLFGACSGLPALEDALRRSILNSRPARILVQTIATLTELGELNRRALQREIAAIETVDKLSAASLHNAADEVQRIRAEAKRVQDLTGIVQTVLMDLNARGGQLVRDQAELVGAALFDHIDDFASLLGVAFTNGTLGSGGRRLSIDTNLLRRQLSDVFETQFNTARAALDELEHLVIPQLVDLLVSNTPGSQASDYPLPPASHIAPPTLSAITRSVSLDLGEPWWRRWWSLILDPDTRRQKLESVVKADFYPIADALEREARRYLQERQAKVLSDATTVFVALAEQLRRHSEAHLLEARRLSLQHDDAVSGRVEREQAAKRIELARKLDETDRALAALGRLSKQWAQSPVAVVSGRGG